MGTPRGSEHRDLEQRFRTVEQRCADLATRVLMQRQLSVTEGDFVVSGGGNVIVRDGGAIYSTHSNGMLAFYVGPFLSDPSTYAFIAQNPDGYGQLRAYHTNTGQDQVWIGHESARPQVVAYGNPVTVDSSTTIGIQAGTAVSIVGQTGVFIDCPGDQLQLGLTGSATYIGHTTTSSAANARLESNGLLTRVTSSLRYKQDVEAADIDSGAVLSVEPRTWRDRAEVEADPETTHRHVGFIAEELDAAGLVEFVEYDDQGRPDAVQYDRLTAALLTVVKTQQDQLDDLTRRVAALES